ncbi:MAG TPA: RNA-binding S4 domain-containing protein [Dongiaceae bacterium]|nr:RNA-binding S4 domain-containing protein [Dongiaceae bacterium]
MCGPSSAARVVIACRHEASPTTRNALPLRLDKFMKVSRLAKRRAEAKDGIEAGRITKDERSLKPGYDVKVGDVLVIHYRTKFLTVRVLLVPERVLPSLKPADMYEIVEERKDDPADWLR